MTPRKLPEHERHSSSSPQHTACIAIRVPHNPYVARRVVDAVTSLTRPALFTPARSPSSGPPSTSRPGRSGRMLEHGAVKLLRHADLRQTHSRRQQVIPAPIPSSDGSFFQATLFPARSRMPSNKAGHPPMVYWPAHSSPTGKGISGSSDPYDWMLTRLSGALCLAIKTMIVIHSKPSPSPTQAIEITFRTSDSPRAPNIGDALPSVDPLIPLGMYVIRQPADGCENRIKLPG